jgi:hypothetical protein
MKGERPYKLVQYGDPRSELNRQRRLEYIKGQVRRWGPIGATVRQIELDPVLQKALREGGLLFLVEEKPPPKRPDHVGARGQKHFDDEREQAALHALNASAAEAFGPGRWVTISKGFAIGGYPIISWTFDCHRNHMNAVRGRFKTRTALLDDYEADTVTYLEWAAGRAA